MKKQERAYRLRYSYPRTELRQVVFRFKEVEDLPPGFSREKPIHSPADLVEQYRFMFDSLTTERFCVFILNSANKIQAVDIVSEGLLNSSLVHPREAFRSAIVSASASVILAHNHPSGNLEPSREDLAITKQMVEAGKIIGIPVHDHIIFCDGGRFTSIAERGMI